MSGTGKRWKPYPAYKNSGVDWLGMVPEGWKVGRVAFGYDIALGKMLQPTPNSEQDLAVPYYRAMNVQWESIDSDLKVMWATLEEIKTFGVRQGDLLVCEGGEVGRAAIINHHVDEPTIIQNALHRVRAFKDYHVGYLLRVLEHVASADWFSVLCNKSTIAHFTGEKFKALKCPLPPLLEQQAIAVFLDQQCAQIDSLIEKKQRMVDLLDEKRRAVITQAVTRGLDPTVPMKDSGVEWLGMVPKGWEIKRLGVISQFIQTGPFGSQLHSEDYIESGMPVINPSHIQNGKIVPDYRCSIDKYNEIRLQRHKLTVGDVVFARRGEMGRCAEILSDDGYICGTGCLQIRFKDNALSAFFSSYLQTEFIRDYLKLESVGSTMDNLNTEILSKIPIPLPPIPEQQAIADYLDAQCAAMDNQRKNLEKSIELLREYRASLITHAVTGKIDVRDVAPLQ